MRAHVTNHARICALIQSFESIGVRARAHIFQSSESIGVLARICSKNCARADLTNHAHIFAFVPSCESIGVRVSAHIFQSSKRIVMLARARAHKNAHASTYQIKCAYVRLSNHAKALVCSEKAPARTYQIMRAYVRDCAQIFPYSESIGVLARTRVLLKMRARTRNKSCAHMCACPVIR